MTLESQKSLRDLRRQIATHFTLDQLRTLAADLGIDWQKLGGQEISSKAQSLIALADQDGRLPDLLYLLHEERPGVPWAEIASPSPGPPETRPLVANQDSLLQSYKDSITALLQKIESDEQSISAEVHETALQETTEILPNLDGSHKGDLVRFLQNADLLTEEAFRYFTGSALEEADLRGMNLAGLVLTGVNLSRARLSQADLSGCDLRYANLGGADLWAANVSYADLNEARLWGANLNKANLHGSNLCGTRLSGANLWGADLSKANLDGAYLWDADLTEANLFQAQYLTEQQLNLVKSLQGAMLPDGSKHEA